MFGILKTSGCGLKTSEREAWMGHVCGLCLALRDNFGHPARLTTNYDAALLSVLCAAQAPQQHHQQTSYCPLRSRFKAQVTAPSTDGAQYAAALALLMAATKIDDHVTDRETFLRYLPSPARHLARKWRHQSEQLATTLGFKSGQITQQTAHQTTVESQPHGDFLAYAQPTELAVGAAFQHTAVIAHRPQNEAALYELGRYFGRIMYLLDSYQDYAADLGAQKFNALAATFPADEWQAAARQLFTETYTELRHRFYQLDLPAPDLARKLLLQQLKRRAHAVLEISGGSSCACALAHAPTATFSDSQSKKKKKRKKKLCDGLEGCDDVCSCGCSGCGECASCARCGFPRCGLPHCDCDTCPRCDCNACSSCCRCDCDCCGKDCIKCDCNCD